MANTRLAAIDWGSSKFRAFLLDGNYRVLEHIETQEGLLHTQTAPRDIFYKHCQHWMEETPGLLVIMCGTVGSNLGWVNTHYTNCPLSIDDLRNEPVDIDTPFDADIKIVPGVSGKSLSGANDVMRGEEVQVFGALDITGEGDALICLPGTHSKWVTVKDCKIMDFTSFMTGEFYNIAHKNSSISNVVDNSEFDKQSFIDGITTAQKQGGILHHLFSARANSLVNAPLYTSISSYLSGVIIGSEIIEALKIFNVFSKVTLVCSEDLIPNYTCALEYYNIPIHVMTSKDAFIRGIAQLDPLHKTSNSTP